jgi:hypothetical protein
LKEGNWELTSVLESAALSTVVPSLLEIEVKLLVQETMALPFLGINSSIREEVLPSPLGIKPSVREDKLETLEW